MSKKGKGPAVKPGGHSATKIFSEGVAARLPRRLEGDSQNQLIQAFKSVTRQPKRPLRPGFGALGNGITLRANFFPVRLPKGPFWDYKVIIHVVEPEGEPERSRKGKERDTGQPSAKRGGKDGSRLTARMKRRLFQLLENDPSFEPYHAHIVHDYSQRIISAKELPQPLDILSRYVEEGEQGPRENAKLYNISIELDGRIDLNT